MRKVSIHIPRSLSHWLISITPSIPRISFAFQSSVSCVPGRLRSEKQLVAQQEILYKGRFEFWLCSRCGCSITWESFSGQVTFLHVLKQLNGEPRDKDNNDTTRHQNQIANLQIDNSSSDRTTISLFSMLGCLFSITPLTLDLTCKKKEELHVWVLWGHYYSPSPHLVLYRRAPAPETRSLGGRWAPSQPSQN